MCELITIAAAVVFTALYFSGQKTKSVFNTMLMFWGAALMWSVDCFNSLREGGPFFELTREDAVLGGIVLAAGLLFFALSSLVERVRRPAGR